MVLRINLLRTSSRAYRERLDQQGIAYTDGYLDETLILDKPCATADLPGFEEGAVAIQDAGAQFAATLIPSQPATPLRILDACAAPGGKFFHHLERHPSAHVTALESQPRRIAAMIAIAERLGHSSDRLINADATTLGWWDRVPFDHILLDAPCSGTGTLRRHPDIKLLREATDIHRHQALQLSLIKNLWQCLRPGGSLLYCTCSLLNEENEHVIKQFVSTQADASVSPLNLPIGKPRGIGWQLLPTDPLTDGFFYARLARAS
jgi:16S rRNA (cytosine967-C5)-methyltransferase